MQIFDFFSHLFNQSFTIWQNCYIDLSKLLHGLVKAVYGFVKIITWICQVLIYIMYFSLAAKLSQDEAWTRCWCLLMLTLLMLNWADSVCRKYFSCNMWVWFGHPFSPTEPHLVPFFGGGGGSTLTVSLTEIIRVFDDFPNWCIHNRKLNNEQFHYQTFNMLFSILKESFIILNIRRADTSAKWCMS